VTSFLGVGGGEAVNVQETDDEMKTRAFHIIAEENELATVKETLSAVEVLTNGYVRMDPGEVHQLMKAGRELQAQDSFAGGQDGAPESGYVVNPGHVADLMGEGVRVARAMSFSDGTPGIKLPDEVSLVSGGAGAKSAITAAEEVSTATTARTHSDVKHFPAQKGTDLTDAVRDTEVDREEGTAAGSPDEALGLLRKRKREREDAGRASDKKAKAATAEDAEEEDEEHF